MHFYKRNWIENDIVLANESGSFKKQLIQHAAKINADMIVIVNTRKGALLPEFFGSDEQEVIANQAEIPVLITNPTQKIVPGGVLGS
jgi:hypothetical protein